MTEQRVLITGGSGFLGTSICRRLLHLDAATSITVLDPHIPATTLLNDFGERIEHDRRTLDDFIASPPDVTFETVIHLAWASIPATSMGSPTRDLEANVMSGVRLLELCSRWGTKRFIFSSSGGTVYGPLQYDAADETHPTRPVSIYGAAKLALETFAQVIALRDGFDAISLRVANPYGPYQLRGVPVGSIANFLLAARSAKPIVLFGDGSIVRDYIDIEDVADAFYRAVCASSLASGPYNVATGIGTSLNRIIELVNDVSGVELAIDRQPDRGFDVSRNVLDWRNFATATGWHPLTSLERGIAEMWQSLP